MPQGPATSPFIKPFVVLALPGMYLFYKYNQYRRRRKENAKRRLTERELQHLHTKIDKLLNKLEESEPELASCPEEECVICINAKATMQTAPCGHQVVCRKCFVKTIQIAVSQRLLPLRCVICRAKILRLKTGPILPSSVSGYSVNSRGSLVPQSDSSFSVSSGGSSSLSAVSVTSDGGCCGGQCMGAYPRASTSSIVTSRRPAHSKSGGVVSRLPPITESPYGGSPCHGPPPAPSGSTRIKCAQKIVTQLEAVSHFGRRGYERLPQDECDPGPSHASGKWWRMRNIQESDDNQRNEITERQLEMKEFNDFRDWKGKAVEGKFLQKKSK